VAGRNNDLNRPVGAGGFIHLLQAFAKGAGNHSDDRIGLRVEVGAPPKRFDGDRMLCDLLILTQEVLLQM